MSSGPEPQCPCCGAANPRNLGRLPDSAWFAGELLGTPLPGGHLFRCLACHLKFRLPVLSEDAYQHHYDNARTTTWAREMPRPDWNLVAAHVHGYLPTGGRVLDFGCYSGGLLAQLDARLERHGVEVNGTAAALAAARTGTQVWPSLDAIPPSMKFDAILAVDVVEHFVDPARLLDRLADRLGDRGIIVITTGDADNRWWNRFGANWWYCAFPEHVAFASSGWITQAATTRRFTMLRCDYFRYGELSGVQRALGFVAMLAYGLLPRVVLRIRSALRSILGKPGSAGAPGAGVVSDHLLIVLKRVEPGP